MSNNTKDGKETEEHVEKNKPEIQNNVQQSLNANQNSFCISKYNVVACLIVILSLIMTINIPFLKILSQPLQNYTFYRKYWVYGTNVESGYLHNVFIVLDRLGFKNDSGNDDWDLLWAHNYPFFELYSKLSNLKPHQRINKFPGSGFITNKVDLATSGLKYIPPAFRLPKDKDKFLDYARSNNNKQFVEKNNNHRYIRIKNVSEIDLNNKDTFVQEFVEKPLLVNGHKFDIGVYVIFTSVDPLRIYIYNGDFLLRFCPVQYYPFDPLNIDKYVVGDDYLPTWEVPGLKYYYKTLGFGMAESLNAYLRSIGKDPSKIWSQIEESIRIVGLTKEQNIINSLKRFSPKKNFFEMMRFDFVVNQDLEVFLMEANMSPNLSSAHFPPNRLLFEQIIFNLLGLVGISDVISKHSSVRSQSAEDMRVTDKNIMVFANECNSSMCRNSCMAPICQLCRPCLTEEHKNNLQQAYREHVNKGSCKRIYPPPMKMEDIDIHEELEMYTPENQFQHRWFKGKCLMDASWYCGSELNGLELVWRVVRFDLWILLCFRRTKFVVIHHNILSIKMDLVRDLLNPRKPLQKIYIPTGQVDGRMLVESDDDQSDYDYLRAASVEPYGNYAEEYKKKEEDLYADANYSSPVDTNLTTFDATEDLLSSMGRLEVNHIRQDELKEVYSKYKFDKHHHNALSIDGYREQILRLVNTNEVVIIEGPTGCGKTTQVPQFILDDCRVNDKPCKIVVTQPRRIAAISVAKRVCEEREWALGKICGYQVGLESVITSDTLLAYVTTGVLLQKLINEKNLHDYTHIIVDEVHERNQDMDFLLLIIRRFLNTNSQNTKVILMSATFDTDEFANYFRNFHHSQLIPAPIIFIDKSCKYTTQKYYADQLSLIGKVPTYAIEDPKIEASLYDIFVVLVRAFDKLDYIDPVTNQTQIGNVLVFLPGILEIEEAHDRLMTKMRKDISEGKSKVEWHVLPLHSSITTEEQRKVFLSPPLGQRKIILSTNIAESSITVPDITFVIDFCLTKTMVMDPDTQYQSLQLQWASHVNCTQRAGRVGRVSDGRVYRLVTTSFYEHLMPKSILPEILRAPLNQVVLSSKLLEISEPPKAILALTMNPPDLTNIEKSVLYLKEVGALTMTCNGQKTVSDGDLTFIGRVMAALPLDVHLSKFILLGHMFSCLEDAIIMATGCSLNIFKSPFKERLKAYTNRLQWADGTASDLVSYLHLYKVWQRKKRLSANVKSEKEWCQKNFVSLRSLNEWYILVKEIKERLNRMHIRQGEGPGNVILTDSEVPMFMKVVMCGAFYPNYFKRSCDGGQIDEREAVKTLGGRDPFNTVYFTGFDQKQPGPIYTNSIKKILRECATDMQVSFDNSSKVYVQFVSAHDIDTITIDGQAFLARMPGKVRTEVFCAVRHRQLKLQNRVALMNSEKAWKIARNMGIDGMCTSSLLVPNLTNSLSITSQEDNLNNPVIPALDISCIHLVVSHRIDAGHFWAHVCKETTGYVILTIRNILNEDVELERVASKGIKIGTMYAAKFSDDNMFYRCKVISLNPLGKTQQTFAQILFVDYGNTEFVGLNDIYSLPNTSIMCSPPQAIECFLSEIQPSVVLNPRALWSEEAISKFDSLTEQKKLIAKIYSVVNNVVYLELYNNRPTFNNTYEFKNSLNAWFITRGYAQHAEESFLSKENHLKRMQVAENPDKLLSLLQDASNSEDYVSVDLPVDDCVNALYLKGPFSPLEMQIFSVVASGSNKKAVIEGNSVNTVLLDTDPQDPHERLIVAAHIGQNPSGTSLSLRHTTLMPNIHGFPMLMSLLFCPIMEPKPTEDGTRIGAILCGLGAFENSNRSIFSAHDICLTLDTVLTEDDINQINEIRYWMNISVDTMEIAFSGLRSTTTISDCQKEIKERLMKLLKTERTSVERAYLKHANVWGKTLYDADTLQPGEASKTIKTLIWPLHWSIKLNTNVTEEKTMAGHVNLLQEVALGMKTVNNITCRLCNKVCHSVGEMRLHLGSKQHREAEKFLSKNDLLFPSSSN
ncbi:hypothetical protein RN001_001542 [Aquatica leii]|uniref:Probable ATP-dependent RNA helicase spindle-E n=1 Tax=Aquatica leii TaxID=1421715 RepID=A0AAN7SCS6_9COLE|nr:hypothetical protein RN001_001542 [Aquatica leii]